MEVFVKCTCRPARDSDRVRRAAVDREALLEFC